MSILLIALFVTLSCILSATAGTPTLRVGTYNVRNSGMPDGPHAWAERRSALLETVRRFDPDVVGFQEVLADQQQDLVAGLPDHDNAAIHRDDGRHAGEAASIFFRRARFDCVARDAFWLSPVADTPGPPAWDAACTRLCTRVVLHDRLSDRTFAVLNTHLDHEGHTARIESAKLIVRQIAAVARPTILMGDFNSTEDGEVYATLLNDAQSAGRPLIDAYRAVHPAVAPDEASFNGFTDQTQGLRIDWLLHEPAFAAVDCFMDRRRSPAGLLPSDHFPLWAVLRFASDA